MSGAFVVPLDGSERAERMVPIAAAWSEQLGGAPWLVCSTAVSQASTCKAHYLSPLAREVRRHTSAVVQYEVIEDGDTAESIVAFARLVDAPLIFMSTHGRTGLSRLRSGSVAAEVLRKAHCPVVMVRPDDLTLEPHRASVGHGCGRAGNELRPRTSAVARVIPGRRRLTDRRQQRRQLCGPIAGDHMVRVDFVVTPTLRRACPLGGLPESAPPWRVPRFGARLDVREAEVILLER